MPVLKKISPRLLIAAYIVALVAACLIVTALHAPRVAFMVMFLPIMYAAFVYPQRLYLIMLPMFSITFLGVILYLGEFKDSIIDLIIGNVGTIIVAEVTHFFINERERLWERLHFRDLTNQAIIDKSPIGISVRSRTGRLLSYNEAWKRIWAMPEEAIQEDMDRERKALSFDLRDQYLGEAKSEVEQVYQQGGQAYFPELKTNETRPGAASWVSQYFYAIQDIAGDVGRVVIMTEDISERKRMEQDEKDNRLFSDALRDIASVLNSTLKLEEVLERILINISKVVPHEAVNIMLLKDNIASIIRCQGYTERVLDETLMRLRLPLGDMPFLRRMAEIGIPVFVEDTSVESEWTFIPETDWIRSYAGAPIRIRGEPVGFLNLDSARAGFYSAQHAERLMAFADQAAIAIENARLYEEVQRLAIMDELTGVYNYRGLFELGQREVERSLRYNIPLSALFFDIDHFRLFNKQYTHSVGNRVLRAVAECSKGRVRTADLVARYGGEEFAILLTQTDGFTASQVADRLRQDIEAMRIDTEYGILGVTVSIGVAELMNGVRDLAMLLDRADQAEHEAKNKGRNRVDMWVKP